MRSLLLLQWPYKTVDNLAVCKTRQCNNVAINDGEMDNS